MLAVRWCSAAWLMLVLIASPAGAQGESWAIVQARQLSAQAAAQAAANQPEAAARLYLEALSIDGSHGPAYLGLAAIRARSGDLREAEQTYTTAIDRIPGFWEAYHARALLRRRTQRRVEARADLAGALGLRRDDAALLELLASWHAEDGEFPRALALYRQLRARVEQDGDEATVARVRLRVKALGLLVGGADPLRARHPGRDAVRQALEGLARTQGL